MVEHFDGSLDNIVLDPKIKAAIDRPFHVIGPGSDFVDDLLKVLTKSEDSEKK